MPFTVNIIFRCLFVRIVWCQLATAKSLANQESLSKTLKEECLLLCYCANEIQDRCLGREDLNEQLAKKLDRIGQFV